MSRILVTAFFVLLATFAGVGTIGAFAEAAQSPDARTVSIAGYATLKLGIVLAFSFFVFVREPARRPSRDPVAFAACVVAVGAVVALEGPPASASTPLVVAGDIVALAFGAWLLAAVLALGRCFGVLPEARGLVTRGPYRLVRHPVYLGELGAAAGLVLAALSARNVAVLAAFVAAQAVRMRLEERALGAEFPDYAAYAARTPRLFPRVAFAQRRTPGSPERPNDTGLETAPAAIAARSHLYPPTTAPEA